MINLGNNSTLLSSMEGVLVRNLIRLAKSGGCDGKRGALIIIYQLGCS